jgi:hypothetical protein
MNSTENSSSNGEHSKREILRPRLADRTHSPIAGNKQAQFIANCFIFLLFCMCLYFWTTITLVIVVMLLLGFFSIWRGELRYVEVHRQTSRMTNGLRQQVMRHLHEQKQARMPTPDSNTSAATTTPPPPPEEMAKEK